MQLFDVKLTAPAGDTPGSQRFAVVSAAMVGLAAALIAFFYLG